MQQRKSDMDHLTMKYIKEVNDVDHRYFYYNASL